MQEGHGVGDRTGATLLGRLGGQAQQRLLCCSSLLATEISNAAEGQDIHTSTQLSGARRWSLACCRPLP